MKYLTIDEMMSGTGVRDSVEGGYLSLDTLSLSDDLIHDPREWLDEYRKQHISGYSDVFIINDFDSIEISLAVELKKQVIDAEVDYYSDEKQKRIPLP